MPWLQTHLTVDKQQAPLVELLFENLGALSVTLEDAGDEPMLEPGPGEMPIWSATRVSGLFTGDTDADGLRMAINQALNAETSRQLSLEVLEDREWERAWLDNFRPMRFGQRLWVCPTGMDVEQADAVVVSLDPGLAFGTGTHPTTALCLQWLDGADIAGRAVIDFGCGSGILAVAALKLGAAQVVAIDHDPQALIATRSNAELNGVADRLVVQGSDATLPPAAEVVLANILANVLIELAPLVSSLTQAGGTLVMSGILASQVPDVIDAYRLDFAPALLQDGWARLEGRKPA